MFRMHRPKSALEGSRGRARGHVGARLGLVRGRFDAISYDADATSHTHLLVDGAPRKIVVLEARLG
eukprot:3425785-Pyramimonas_sp.AAC.2